MAKNIKSYLITGIMALAGLYLVLLLYFIIAEDSFVFHPNYTTRNVSALDSSFNYKAISIITKDEETIKGFEITCADTNGYWVLFLHGNSGNISDMTHPERAKFYNEHGYNVLIIDYRGFGESTGTPSENGLYIDAMAAFDYLSVVKGVPNNRIIIHGWSLGSGVASKLASEVKCKALILEGAFTSVPAVGERLYPFIPARLISKNKFDTESRIDKINCGVLFLHAYDDQQIPYDMSETLYAKANEPKAFIKLKGGHIKAYKQSKELMYNAIDMFINNQK